MEGRHVDVTVISAEGLKKVTMFGKMRCYATVWIDPHYRQSTAVDDNGGDDPEWNQRLSFPVPEHFFHDSRAQVTIQIHSKSTLLGDKLVGEAAIPVAEAAQKANQDEVSTHAVRRTSGKVKGSVRLSIRVGERTSISAAPMPAAYPPNCEQYDGQYGYPPAEGYAAPYGYPAPGPAPYPQPAYGQQGYYQQPPYYQAQQPPQRRPGGGGMGMGLGAGLLAGAAGGLIAGELMDDAFDGDGGD